MTSVLKSVISYTDICGTSCNPFSIECFFPATSVSSTNKIDCHDISEILLKVALNTITSSNPTSEYLDTLMAPSFV